MIGETYTLSQLVDSAVKWLIAMALDISSSAPLIFLFFLLLIGLFIVLFVLVKMAGGFKWIIAHVL